MEEEEHTISIFVSCPDEEKEIFEVKEMEYIEERPVPVIESISITGLMKVGFNATLTTSGQSQSHRRGLSSFDQ